MYMRCRVSVICDTSGDASHEMNGIWGTRRLASLWGGRHISAFKIPASRHPTADGQLRPHTLPTPAPSSHLRLSLILISRSLSPSPWPLSSTSTPESSTRPGRTALASASSANRTLPPSPARTSGRATRRAGWRWRRASSTTRAGVSGVLAACQRATQSTPSSCGCSRAASRCARWLARTSLAST
jgi:hypothetical protein